MTMTDHDPPPVEAFNDLGQLVALLDLSSVEPAPMNHHAEAVVRLDDMIAELTDIRDRHAGELLTASRAMPKGPFNIYTFLGPVKVTRGKSTSRTKVQHAKLQEVLSRLADTPPHRLNPSTGEMLDRPAARLALLQRCMSLSPKWGRD